MRHRSPRPLLDIWRWRPSLPGPLRRVVPLKRVLAERVVAAARVRGGAVGAAAVALATVAGIVMMVSQFGGGARTDAATDPIGERTTGSDVSRGVVRTPAPSSSAPSDHTPGRRQPTSNEEPAEPSTQRPSRSQAPEAAPPAPPETRSDSPSPARESKKPRKTGSPTPSPTPTSTSADATAPETTASTISVDDAAWVVGLAANEPAAFECSMDEGSFVPCAPTTEFTGLDDGDHTLLVRAVDESGNRDKSPAELTADLVEGLVGDLDDEN